LAATLVPIGPDSWHVRAAPDCNDAPARQPLWHCHNTKQLSAFGTLVIVIHCIVLQ